MQKIRFFAAAKVATAHFGLSLLVAALIAYVVLKLWFPFPYRTLAGGQHLFWLTMGVVVICGPVLTAVLFNPAKSRRELVLDFSLIALVQTAAVAYSLYSVAQARPVVLAFEIDRMVAVSAAQIERQDLPQAPTRFQSLSWTGPILLSTRNAKDSAELFESIGLSLQGKEPSLRPGWWQTYDEGRPFVKKRMKNLENLHATVSVEMQKTLSESAKESGLPLSQLFYLPLTSQKVLEGWIVLLDGNANIVGSAAVDGF